MGIFDRKRPESFAKGVGASLVFALSTFASAQDDHANLDKERPLRFEDAICIERGSLEFKTGFRVDSLRDRKPIFNVRSEFQYGLTDRSDLTIGWGPFYDYFAGGFQSNVAEISYFETVGREVAGRPAFGYRLDFGFPVYGSRSGAESRLRSILTKTLCGSHRLHANLDVTHEFAPVLGERATRVGLILGYSTLLRSPARHGTTLLAELGAEQGKPSGSALDTWIGVGFRRQLSATDVLDFGIQSDLRRTDGFLAPFRISLGYSLKF